METLPNPPFYVPDGAQNHDIAPWVAIYQSGNPGWFALAAPSRIVADGGLTDRLDAPWIAI
jgi:hypothetical protein